MALLLLGFWKLQIINSDRYAQLAERNRIRSIPIIAPRGAMLDRYGRVIVDNYPSFSVLLLRDDPDQLDRLLPQIADGLSLTLDDVQQQLDAAKTLPHFQPIVIKPEATPGRHRLHRIASRRYSRAGNAHGASPALSAGRVHGARQRLRGRSQRRSDRRAMAAIVPAISSARPAWRGNTTSN